MREIIEYIKKNNITRITVKDLVNGLGVSESTARRKLNKLVKAGVARKVKDQGRYVYLIDIDSLSRLPLSDKPKEENQLDIHNRYLSIIDDMKKKLEMYESIIREYEERIKNVNLIEAENRELRRKLEECQSKLIGLEKEILTLKKMNRLIEHLDIEDIKSSPGSSSGPIYYDPYYEIVYGDEEMNQ